jgi:predicted nucleotidyltransferase
MVSLRSKTTQKLLNYFFINPHASLYVNELVRNLGVDKRNLVRILKELENKGLLESKERGNLKLYAINKGYPLYREYKNILMKTTGLEDKLKRIAASVKGVSNVYIYGSYAQGKMGGYSDIDVLIVGSHPILPLQKKLNVLQVEIGREINSVHMDEREFKKRIKNKDPFLLGVLKKKHIQVI